MRSDRCSPATFAWLSSQEAAFLLDVTPAEPAYLARHGYIQGHKHEGRWHFEARSVERYVEHERRYISMAGAAELVGLPISAVKTAAARGLIEQRSIVHSRPSLDRKSVLAWADRHRAERAAAEEERQAAEALRRAWGPPQDGDVWLSVSTTAVLLGLSETAVRRRANEDLLPAVRTAAGRWWFRRNDIEQVAAARAMSRLQRAAKRRSKTRKAP